MIACESGEMSQATVVAYFKLSEHSSARTGNPEKNFVRVANPKPGSEWHSSHRSAKAHYHSANFIIYTLHLVLLG
jgi:hypothetical protein